MFTCPNRSGLRGAPYEYQLVESFRSPGRLHQRQIATLAWRYEAFATRALNDLIRSLTRSSGHLRIVQTVRSQVMKTHEALSYWPLVFGRLWEEQDLPQNLPCVADGHRSGGA